MTSSTLNVQSRYVGIPEHLEELGKSKSKLQMRPCSAPRDFLQRGIRAFSRFRFVLIRLCVALSALILVELLIGQSSLAMDRREYYIKWIDRNQRETGTQGIGLDFEDQLCTDNKVLMYLRFKANSSKSKRSIYHFGDRYGKDGDKTHKDKDYDIIRFLVFEGETSSYPRMFQISVRWAVRSHSPNDKIWSGLEVCKSITRPGLLGIVFPHIKEGLYRLHVSTEGLRLLTRRFEIKVNRPKEEYSIADSGWMASLHPNDEYYRGTISSSTKGGRLIVTLIDKKRSHQVADRLQTFRNSCQIARILRNSEIDNVSGSDWIVDDQGQVDTRKFSFIKILLKLESTTADTYPRVSLIHFIEEVFLVGLNRVYVRASDHLLKAIKCWHSCELKPDSIHKRLRIPTDCDGCALTSYRQPGFGSSLQIVTMKAKSGQLFADIDIDSANPCQDLFGLVRHCIRDIILRDRRW